MNEKIKIIRTATVALSLDVLLNGQLKYLDQHFEVIGVSGQDHHLDQVKSREHVKTIAVKMARPIHPVQDVKSLFRLYRVFKKEKPQIVHSITPKAGLLSMIAANFAGVPIRIHTFTGLLFPYKSGFFQWLLLTMDKVLCQFATHIIPEGQGVKNDLIKFKVTKKPLEVIAFGNVNGINTKHFHPDLIPSDDVQKFNEKHTIKPTDKVFVYIGRKVRDKGNEELIQAINRLAKVYPNLKLIYVGPYEETDSLSQSTHQLIDELTKNNVIIPFGFEKDIRLFLKVADVLILPSYREGFPNILLQALAMETPCIATNICGCDEIIQNNQNGFLIQKQSETELYEAIEKYILDDDLVNQQKPYTRSMIREKYDNAVVWSALLNYYNKMIKEAKLEN